LANASDWQLFAATAAVSITVVLGAYYVMPMACSTIASTSISMPMPFIMPTMSISASGTLSMGAAAGIGTVTISGSNAAVIAIGMPLVYMAAQGAGDNIDPSEDTVLDVGPDDPTVLDIPPDVDGPPINPYTGDSLPPDFF
jgi:hypothetical protein